MRSFRQPGRQSEAGDVQSVGVVFCWFGDHQLRLVPGFGAEAKSECGDDIDAGGNRGFIAETGFCERAHEAADVEERGLLICFWLSGLKPSLAPSRRK